MSCPECLDADLELMRQATDRIRALGVTDVPAIIVAADALADAVEAFLNWTDPYDYEGVAQARRAVPAALRAYRKARK